VDGIEHVESQVVTLAASLGGEGWLTGENARLHREIEGLILEVEVVSSAIAASTKRSTTLGVALLEKELASFRPQAETLDLEARLNEEAYAERKERVCELLVSDSYTSAIECIYERRVAQVCRNAMGVRLTALHKEMDAARSDGTGKRTSFAGAVRDAPAQATAEELVSARLAQTEAELRRSLAESHRRWAVRAVVAQIEEMSDMIEILGVDGVDLAEVRERVGWSEIEAPEKETAERAAAAKPKANDKPARRAPPGKRGARK